MLKNADLQMDLLKPVCRLFPPDPSFSTYLSIYLLF